MGLSRIEIDFYKRLIVSGAIRAGGDVLELGETQAVESPLDLVDRLEGAVAPAIVEVARSRIVASDIARSRYQRRYGPARALYGAIFQTSDYTGIDLLPEIRSLWADLNKPVALNRCFDHCINNGTSEHVFNQANLFKVMHDHTKVGGLMIHWTPTLGWADHGLYNVQPGFFFDLAYANDYEVVRLEAGALEWFRVLAQRDDYKEIVRAEPALRNALVCAALRKTSDIAFRMPMQEAPSIADSFAASFALTFSAGCEVGWRQPDRPNLALKKPATQSSTSEWSYSDDPCEDAAGANNGVLTGCYGFHTGLDDEPWWKVDLTEMQDIREVAIFNRLDSPSVGQQSGLYVAVSADDAEWADIAATTVPIAFGGADGRPLRVVLDQPVRARYVKVGVRDRSYFHLDEVQVY